MVYFGTVSMLRLTAQYPVSGVEYKSVLGGHLQMEEAKIGNSRVQLSCCTVFIFILCCCFASESSKRVARPGHYMFKIKSFTLVYEVLRKTPDVESYEPPAFDACGHKWKLSLYPNGNKKLGGEDHISLYLVSADDEIDAAGAEITAMFKLFIMDQIRDEYLTIQDGVVRRFHGLKKEWGFTKLIPLDAFKDPTNGYLVNDCCVFGVEILVMIPSKVELACFSLINNPVEGTFTWTVDNFSSCRDLVYQSKAFKVEGHEWKLWIYPSGESKRDGDYLSFYLFTRHFSYQSKIFVDYDLIVKDQLSGNHSQRNVEYWFDSHCGYGFPNFMKLADIKDESK